MKLIYKTMFCPIGSLLIGIASIVDGLVRIISLGRYATHLRLKSQLYANRNFFRPQEFHHHQGRDEM